MASSGTEKKDPRLPNRTPLTDEQKERYIEALYNGLDPAEAAKEIGTTGTNVRRFRSPNSIHYDEEFAEKAREAIESTEHRSARLERARAETFKRALEGSDRLLEKVMIVLDPEWRMIFGTQRVSLEADVRTWAERALPGVPQEQLDAMILTLEAKAKELPPASENGGD